MTYCISDIHGEYGLFMRLLEKIKFSACDKMIICGDFIDKGKDSVRLAKAIFAMDNVLCIKGNHEHMFCKFYSSQIDVCGADFEAMLLRLQGYFPYGGELLDWDTVDRINDLPYYIEEKDFICVHAGVPLDPEGKILPLDSASPEELVNDRHFKNREVLPRGEKCVFFGHTPTTYIQKEPRILAYPKHKFKAEERRISDYAKIHLDTGTALSGVLGCFCTDTCRAFYVKK